MRTANGSTAIAKTTRLVAMIPTAPAKPRRRSPSLPVGELVTEVLSHWPGSFIDQSNAEAPHEATLLQVSSDKAQALLAWSPVWSFSEAVCKTISWYRETNVDSANIQSITSDQIDAYT